MTIAYTADHHDNPPVGVRGGLSGGATEVLRLDSSGKRLTIPLVGVIELEPGEFVVSTHSGGGGYGDPYDRQPPLVLRDVLAGWVSIDAARATYGVEIVKTSADGSLQVDVMGTNSLRKKRTDS
jgi:N-methylhydantoinase B